MAAAKERIANASRGPIENVFSDFSAHKLFKDPTPDTLWPRRSANECNALVRAVLDIGAMLPLAVTRAIDNVSR